MRNFCHNMESKRVTIILLTFFLLIYIYFHPPGSISIPRNTLKHLHYAIEHPDSLSNPPQPSLATLDYQTSCFTEETLFFHDLLSFLKKSKIAVIQTETVDLLDSSKSFSRRLLTTNLVRLGVFGEDVAALQSVIGEIENFSSSSSSSSTTLGPSCIGKPKKSIKVMKSFQDAQLVNVFFILRKEEKNNQAAAFMKKKELPYFPWKRLHLRIYYQRGHESKLYKKVQQLFSKLSNIQNVC